MNTEVLKHLASMRHSPIHNYIVPGLTSWLILDRGKHGMVRMFECAREQHEHITPHSHRFDFTACVLSGYVENTIWTGCDVGPDAEAGDAYSIQQLVYENTPGRYTKGDVTLDDFVTRTVKYKTGDWYSMTADQIHSIKFSKGAQVIFFEGESKSDITYALEPFVDGEILPTMRTEPWMFKKGVV